MIKRINTFNFDAQNAKENNFIGKKISEMRKARKLKQDDFCNLLRQAGVDLGVGAVSKWEQGQTIPSSYQLLAVCSVFDIDDPVSFFTGKHPLNREGMEKLSAYKSDLIATGLYAPVQKSAELIYIQKAFCTLSVSAGTGNFLSEDSFEMKDFPAHTVPENADFALKICGDSMEPIFANGQTVWVKKCEELRPGEVGIFVYDGEGYIKMYSERTPNNTESYTDSQGITHKQPVLISYNKKYSNIVVSPDKSFQIIGKVL